MDIVTSTIEYPRLRHCTFVIRNDVESIFLVFGQDYYEVAKKEGDYKKFMSLKRYMDGRHTIDQIAEKTGVALDDVRDIVETLRELGLFRKEEPVTQIDKDVFVKAVKDISVMWSRQVGYHRLYASLERTELPKEVFVGLLIETYHYVASAPKHIANAIAHCRDKHLEKILIEYFLEEYNHAGLILETLGRLGVSRDAVLHANPGIGTTSLISMLCDIGRANTLAYLACTSLFEAKKEDFESAKDSMERICKNFGYEPTAVAPMLEHMRGDIEADHKGLLDQALDNTTYIDAKQAHEIVNFVHDLKHAFDQYHDSIISYYDDIASYIPRLFVDYFSL